MSEHRHPVERRRIDALHEHPRQHELVGDLPHNELDELVASMRRDGQREPIHVLPDGIVVAGHQRLRAARHLGLEEVDVVVRNDLAAAGEREVLRFLVEDNLHRRQMGPLELARAYRELKVIDRCGGRSGLTTVDRRDFRDRLAVRLGAKCSGRTLDRYERLLDAPREVQDAFIAGQLPMTAGLKVVALPKDAQQQIASAIAAGESPRDVIARCCGRSESVTLSPFRAYRDLLHMLGRVLNLVDDNAPAIVGTALEPDRCISLLGRARDVIAELYDLEVAANVEHANSVD